MSDSAPTHYERLGITQDATTAEIRRAYRALAKTAHPDAGGDSASFRVLSDAYETLLNPLLRKEYDERLDVDRFVQERTAGPTFDLDGDEMTVRSKRDRAGGGGWHGTDGTFTGDVGVPDYLQDVFERPWTESAGAGGQTHHEPFEQEPTVTPADLLWHSPTPSIVAPTLTDHAVLCATDDDIVAIDAYSGRELWHAGVIAPAACPVNLVDDTVIAWTADGLLHGLESERGVTRWERPVGKPGRGELTVAGNTVVVATSSHVLGVGPRDGKVRWQASLVAPPTVPMVAVGPIAIVGTERGIDAFDLRRGRVRWRAPSRHAVDVALCPSSGSVWVSTGGGTLHRVDANNGATLGAWDVRSPIAGLADDGSILYASVVGPSQLVAVDRNGFVRWATGLATTSPQPALIAGTAHVADPSGEIVSIDTVDGSVLGRLSLPIEPFGPPLGFVDRLIVQARDGRICCVDLDVSGRAP